jgi:hypothetical protein
MAKFLFDVQHKNRLEQRGLLKRFTMTCYGKQDTMEELRAEKAAKYKELKKNRKSREFEMWFLKYVPADLKNDDNQNEPKIELEEKENPTLSENSEKEPEKGSVKVIKKNVKSGDFLF